MQWLSAATWLGVAPTYTNRSVFANILQLDFSLVYSGLVESTEPNLRTERSGTMDNNVARIFKLHKSWSWDTGHKLMGLSVIIS
ncbi:hypothetical protein PanWU01x14_170790 [Parasponia andersonii]|uniref:Uncharacterized protein n=1 Tax=Parasponia andersonii TaxID=3476 RepID=A0A2P5C9V9_PARAD|nr:hypothetical protein PanWU01x14_170790 [Parasponia andersonii]